MNRSQMIVSVSVLLGVLLINKSYSQQYYGAYSGGRIDSCGYDFGPANYSGFDQYRSSASYYRQTYGGPSVYHNNQSFDCPREIEFANRAYGINPTGFDQFDSMAPIRSQSSGHDFGCPDCDQSLNGYGQAFHGRQQNNLSLPPRPNLGRDFADQQPRLQTPLTPSQLRRGLPQQIEAGLDNSTKLTPPPQLPPQDNRIGFPQNGLLNRPQSSN